MIPDTSQIYFPAEDTHLLIRAALAEVKESDSLTGFWRSEPVPALSPRQ